MGPLAGVRVLDVTNVLAGPFCGHLLAHLGADVIKVEAPGRGDLARELGASPTLSARKMGVSFLAQNAGKASITLNLKHPKGAEALIRLVPTADVLVENFRPGVMARLGLGATTLREVHPSLIYAAISGFGQDGPLKDRPAYDQIVQGTSGVMSITGQPDGNPTRVGFPVADTVGGLTAAMAICAALTASPRGGVIDVSMTEALMATMGWAVSNWLIAGVPPERAGNENLTSAPSGTFQAADGLLNIAANREEQWQALVTLLGLQDLNDDPRFATREARKANRLVLKATLETVLTTRPADAWVAEMNAVGIPAGPVLSVMEALAHPQIAERGLVGRFADVPGVGDVAVMRPGVKMDGDPLTVDRPPPTLGADTDDVLLGIGYTRAELDAMRKEGAI